MIQIWKDNTIISVQDTIENAEYFCEKNNLKDVKFVKVLD